MEAPRLTELWRNADFLKFWGGLAVSQFGSQFGALSLTAVVFLQASPGQVGVLAAAGGLPILLLSLFAGVVVDWLPRRFLMIATDLARAALLGSVPLAALVGLLSIEQLYIVAFLVGGLTLFFDLAFRAHLPSIVGRSQLVEGNSKLEMSSSVAEVAGPASGGALVHFASGPLAVLVDALTFVISAALISLTRKRQVKGPPVGAERKLRLEITAGLAEVNANRLLRALALGVATFSLFGGVLGALFPLYVIRELQLSAVTLGLTVAAGGLAYLAGTLIASWLTTRLGLGRTMIATRVLGGVATLLIPVASGSALLTTVTLLVAQLLAYPLWAVWEINQVSLRQAITPDRLQGRVNATLYLLDAGAFPVGALIGGGLAMLLDVRIALFIAVAGLLLGSLWLLLSPVRQLQRMPNTS